MTEPVITSVFGGDDQRWLRWLDAECFPDDKPLMLGAASWALARYDDEDPVAFCGWCRHGDVGFHYRAGVHPAVRGQGLQKLLIAHRENAMRNKGIKTAVTYTEAYSAASMRSLIACGYRPFEADENTGLVLDPRYWKTMVYWKRDLT